MPSSPQQKAETWQEKALKILEHSRKTLSVEEESILGVLQDFTRQVEIVAMLPVMLAQLDILSSRMDKNLYRTLREHQLLEERLESALKQGSDGIQGETGQAREREIAQLVMDIQSSIENVLRLFRAYPLVALRAGEVGMSENMQCLVGGLKIFNGLVLERMLTSQAEEKQWSLYIQEESSCRANDKEQIASLEKKLAAATKHRDTTISICNDVIEKLKSAIHQTEKKSENVILRMQQDADEKWQSAVKTSEAGQTRMQHGIDQLNIQLSKRSVKDREERAVLRQPNDKLEKEMGIWMEEYDTEMEAMQVELEETEKAYEEVNEELRELKEAYAILEPEYRQGQEECQLAEEARKRLELETRATIVIQSWCRGYCVRKAMKAKAMKAKAMKAKAMKGKKRKGKKGMKGK
ncbi:dynein regulatory complex protein 10-like [Diretmus argenteus]